MSTPRKSEPRNLKQFHILIASHSYRRAADFGALLFHRARFGWSWADPLAALCGAALIAHFATSILKRAGAALLDIRQTPALEAEILGRLEAAGLQPLEVRAWRLGPGRNAVSVKLGTPDPEASDQVRRTLVDLPGVSRISLDLS